MFGRTIGIFVNYELRINEKHRCTVGEMEKLCMYEELI